MKTLLFFFVIFFLLKWHPANSQQLVIDSTRFITGIKSGTDISYSIPTSDKGILFVGTQYGNPGGIIPTFLLDTALANVFVGKIDSNRQISWLKVYGGSREDGAVSACQTTDGGYAVLASTVSSNGDVTGYKGSADMWLLRLDASGNLLWQKTYGSTENDAPRSIANTLDNGFIIFGATNGNDGDVPFHHGGFFEMDWLVIKIDSSGTVQWSKVLGTTGSDGGFGSIMAVDSAYYLVSTAVSKDFDCTDTAWHSGVKTYADYYMLKLALDGNVIWSKGYGGTLDEYAFYAMFDSRDSTFLITGKTSSNDYMVSGYHGWDDAWIIKVSKSGTLVWQKALGSLHGENGTGICSTVDGYIAYCRTINNGVTDPSVQFIGSHDCWLFSLDNSGNVLTNKIFGGTDVDGSSSIVPSLNGYAAFGLSGSPVFTEGSCNGSYTGAFVSYLGYWPLNVKDVNAEIRTLNIYPNPAQNYVHIALPENERGRIDIVNCMGQTVYSEQILTSTNVNASEWSNGLYLIRWQGEGGQVLATKLIKN